ncbi:MAG: hypothetical protein KatS3mg063_0857 [Tepidiforma sp.]|uniref:hypothetical protein n=1 Tax=Tepidiforma sp. TaxID=2682230 RepID=UPI0021DDA983|nr:hypothetical protein [Tepidiforma sp.]GIW15004.1 MAG: hypothetical protein KatS3mg063_0857 [Tepidiforma sp.]
MGRRRSRKAERRQQRREWTGTWREDPGPLAAWEELEERRDVGTAWQVPFGSSDDALWEAFAARASEPARPEAAAARTCGGCREFVEDGDLGRGTCLHPGSGVLHPWTDTPACEFWSRGRRDGVWRP